MADEDSQQKIEKKKTDKNVCCHFCRISQNRNRRILGYAICNGCRKSYCRRCLEKYLDEDFETLAADESKAWQCLCCKLQCCCCFQLCTKDHRHCFTYRRTQQRHISVAPKWTKRKKGEEAKDDDDEPSPQRAKRKYTKRKQDDPLKNKRLNVNTNGEEMEDYNPSDDSGEGVTSDDDSVNEEEEEATGNLLGFVGSFKKEKSGQIRLDALPQNVTAEELKLLTEQAALQDEKDGESPTSKKKKDSKKEPRKGRKGKKDEEGTFPFPHGFPPPLLPFGAPYNPMGLMRPFDSRMAPPLIMPIPPLPPYPMPPQGYYPLAMHPGPSAQQQQLLFMQQQQQQQMMMNHFPPGFNPQAPFLFPPPALQTGFPYPGALPGVKAPAQEGIEGAASDLANIGAEQQPQEEPAYAEVKEDASNGMHEEKPADSGGVVEAEITTGLAITTSEAANGASSNNDFNAYPASATTNNTSENKIF